MLLTLAKFELKNLLRDKMTIFMFIYPLVLGGLGKYLITNNYVDGAALGITAMLMAILTGFAYGAMAGFSLLDDRDDHVFTSLQIAPISLNYYIWFKVLFTYLLAVLSSFFIVWVTGVFTLAAGDLILISALSALQTPLIAFIINAFAQNKVEGFVTMKAAGLLLLLPIGSYFFLDVKEWLFAIAPGFWPAKAVQYSILQPQIDTGLISMNLNFYQYILLGFAYNLLLITAAFGTFRKKNDI
ncbi:MAG TPA: hypothetical protein DCE00_01135 [Firmicutes bacterium]|jgi:fluoroquinolone transport system permease protein|nr:hypothetical protein [Bacillota bacterium]HAA37456.1 hypothetical protein [Bacillota bacterium]